MSRRVGAEVYHRLLGQVLRVPVCADAAVRRGREHDGGGGGGGGRAGSGLHHAHAAPHQSHLQHGEQDHQQTKDFGLGDCSLGIEMFSPQVSSLLSLSVLHLFPLVILSVLNTLTFMHVR